MGLLMIEQRTDIVSELMAAGGLKANVDALLKLKLRIFFGEV